MERVGGSYRDPAGFVFRHEGRLYRSVSQAHGADYDLLMGSGLYDELVRDGLLVSHEEVALERSALPDSAELRAAHRILRPHEIPFVSYPYEWCFGQFKAAASLTLDLCTRALARGLVLRDASAFNVQFLEGRPVFIDTLSFGRYDEGKPWDAYQQFCRHFLAPLALMSYRGVWPGEWWRHHLEGLPLDVASRLLPWRARLRPGLSLHVTMHASQVRRHEETAGAPAPARRSFGRASMLGLLDSLRRTVDGLTWTPASHGWSTYYETCTYDERGLEAKTQGVRQFLATIAEQDTVRHAWDLGANTGVFSEVAAGSGLHVVSFDLDLSVVERLWQACRARGERRILPLIQDVCNPSPGLGWEGGERASLADRGPADVLLVLALVHHVAIGRNVPLGAISRMLARLGRWLVIEFVPKDDPQVVRLLRWREDVFADYTEERFREAFARDFACVSRVALPDSGRSVYLMRRR